MALVASSQPNKSFKLFSSKLYKIRVRPLNFLVQNLEPFTTPRCISSKLSGSRNSTGSYIGTELANSVEREEWRTWKRRMEKKNGGPGSVGGSDGRPVLEAAMRGSGRSWRRRAVGWGAVEDEDLLLGKAGSCRLQTAYSRQCYIKWNHLNIFTWCLI